MVERVKSRRGKDGKRRGARGGRRANQGRRLGSVNAAKRVARAVAAKVDLLPHELLLRWARTGKMTYPSGRVVELEPSDRITCAKGCAAWYKPAMQPRVAPGEQPPVVRLEVDPEALRAMAVQAPDKLEVFRDVLKIFQAGGADLAQASQGAPGQADPSRYARMLSESSETEGRA